MYWPASSPTDTPVGQLRRFRSLCPARHDACCGVPPDAPRRTLDVVRDLLPREKGSPRGVSAGNRTEASTEVPGGGAGSTRGARRKGRSSGVPAAVRLVDPGALCGSRTTEGSRPQMCHWIARDSQSSKSIGSDSGLNMRLVVVDAACFVQDGRAVHAQILANLQFRQEPLFDYRVAHYWTPHSGRNFMPSASEAVGY